MVMRLHIVISQWFDWFVIWVNSLGKLSLDEYLSDDEIRGLSMLDEATEKKRFEENYDLNHDGFLDMEELKRWVIPDLE